MKIRVTLILLLCTSLAANGIDTLKTQQTSSNSKFSDNNDSEQRHQVHEYSKSMEALNVASRIENRRTIERDVPSFGKSFNQESENSLKHLTDMRMNSKQPPRGFQAELLPVQEKGKSLLSSLSISQSQKKLLIYQKLFVFL